MNMQDMRAHTKVATEIPRGQGVSSLKLYAPFDLHMHTTYSDGRQTPEEMIDEACKLGLHAVGISDHSHVSFEPDYCLGAGGEEQYQRDVRSAAARFESQIQVYCGIEQDIFSEPVQPGFDYVIGSVHYVEIPPKLAKEAGGYISADGAHAYVSVDDTEDLYCRACEVCFDGDYLAFAQAYFNTVSRVVEVTGAHIVGHLDLFAKFNEGNRYFDEQDNRYVRAWQQACDALLKTPAVFEINHGARVSGRRTQPYPAKPIQAYLEERGAQFVLSSDAHSSQALCATWEAL